MLIDHVVNPVKVCADSDLYVAQPVTFRAMDVARRNASHQDVGVELYAIAYPEDSLDLPPSFHRLNDLKRSVMDAGKFRHPKKLPLIRDILDAVVSEAKGDFIIYSNVDISPMPYFYDYVAEQLSQHDALVINRRTIDKADDHDKPLSEFYSQIGQPHPGFDCFVFSKTLYEKFYLGDACIGANWIGRVLLCNLLAYSESAYIEKGRHLTFHLGDDRSWKTSKNLDFDEHNESVLRALMQRLHQDNLLTRDAMLQRTYEEFVTKSIDPDPYRPKRDSEESVSNDQSASVNELFEELRLDGDWSGYSHNILNQEPLFIVGYPRSGTTLLQSLIATQYSSAVFPETHYFSIIRTMLSIRDGIIEDTGLDETLSFIKEKLTISRELEVGIREAVKNKSLSSKMLFESIVYEQLSNRLNKEDVSREPWIEKTPDHVHHLSEIRYFYPKAIIVFVVRNPERAIISRRKHFTWNDEVSWPIQKHVKRWLDAIADADGFRREYPDQIYYIRFEDIVENQEKSIEMLCDFLGINFCANELKNYAKFSQQQSMPWETWKQEAKAEVSHSIAEKNEKLSDDDLREMRRLAITELTRFRYDTNGRHGSSVLSRFLSMIRA